MDNLWEDPWFLYRPDRYAWLDFVSLHKQNRIRTLDRLFNNNFLVRRVIKRIRHG